VPWLTAALFVDEIDAIVPRRSGGGGSSETKVDGLSIILALYGGPDGKDVPNFFLGRHEPTPGDGRGRATPPAHPGAWLPLRRGVA
jgi:hypothetical protein